MAEGAQLVDAVAVVGMVVGIEDGVEARDAGVEELQPQVRRGVDKDDGAALLHQHGYAPPPVARIGRIAVTPVSVDQRHAAGAAAAEDRHLHAGTGERALVKRRKKFAVVVAARSTSGVARRSATWR